MISRNHYMVLLASRISARFKLISPHFLASEAFHTTMMSTIDETTVTENKTL